MQLTVERIKPAGKSLIVTSAGKDYFAKKDSGIQQGMTIEAETEDSDYNGKSYCWIKKWKALSNATAPAPAVTGNAHPSSSGQSAPWLPFASNTVAHAINAGLIQNPEQVKVWAAAAKAAYMELA